MAETQVITEARNASFSDFAQILKSQGEVRKDVVAPATSVRSVNGLIYVDGLTVFPTPLHPTTIFDGDVAAKLGIPVKYLRRLRAERPDLYDLNVNGLLQGDADKGYEADGRSFYVRTFLEDGATSGIARSLQSDRKGGLDNWDALLAALDGIKNAGMAGKVDFVKCDLSERRMNVRIACPAVGALAPILLGGYNAPVPGWGSLEAIRKIAEREGQAYEPGTEPVVFAGIDITNGETGCSAMDVSFVLVAQLCGNGLKVDVGAGLHKIHLGSKLDQGIVKVSDETRQKNIELVTAQTADLVATFLDPEFVQTAVDKIEALAGKPVTDAAKTVEHIAKTVGFTEEQAAGILGHFVIGGQMTAGGVLNAVTSYAQTVTNPDVAYDMEMAAMQVLALAAAE